MEFPLGVLFGAIAMLGWGAADFFAAKTVRKTGALRTLLWSQAIELVLLFLAFAAFPALRPVTPAAIGMVLLAGILNVAAYLAYYRGFRVGKVSVVSPVSACYAAVTVLLGMLFLKEALTALQAVGVSLAIIGAVLVSFRLRNLAKAPSSGAGYGTVAMLGWGIYFVLLGFLAAELGWFLPLLLTKGAEVFFLLAYGGVASRGMRIPATPLVALVGLLEGSAFLAYGLGISFEYTSVVAPVSAAYPAVTLVMARVLLKEKLDANQKLGVLSVLAGLILLSLG